MKRIAYVAIVLVAVMFNGCAPEIVEGDPLGNAGSGAPPNIYDTFCGGSVYLEFENPEWDNATNHWYYTGIYLENNSDRTIYLDIQNTEGITLFDTYMGANGHHDYLKKIVEGEIVIVYITIKDNGDNCPCSGSGSVYELE